MNDTLINTMGADIYNRIFENARDAKLIVDPSNGNILEGNRAALSMYGYSYEELLKLSIYDLRRGEGKEIISKQINIASRDGVLFETVHYNSTGKPIPVEVSSINIDENGNKLLLSIIRDISERKDKEEQIRLNEYRLELLYEAMDEGVSFNKIITDEFNDPVDYLIINVNNSFGKIFNFEISDLIGKTAKELFPNMNQKWIDEFGEVAMNGISKKLEYYVESAMEYYEIKVYSPKKGFFSLLFTDITDLKHKERELSEKYEELSVLYEELLSSEEELKDNYKQIENLKEEADRANRAKSIFLANMSHELRTPLSGIMGMANLLKFSRLNEIQEEYCDIINSSGEHLLKIINNILDISKIEEGKLELIKNPFELKGNVERIIKTTKIDADKKGLEIKLNYQILDNEILIGDVHRLNQIMVNLLGNAVKYCENGFIALKVIKIKNEVDKAKYLFSITDTGIGIDKSLDSKLFQVFSQGNSSYDKKYQGTGLGLAICKELVTMMNGEIWYESEVGIGTTFHFTVELDKTGNVGVEKELLRPLDTKIDEKNLGKCILIAEDNKINMQLINAYLDKRGYKLINASNGEEAYKEFINNEVDLVLMDIQMPVMNGFEATKAMRQIKGEKHVPIIAMTAYAMEKDKEVCFKAGMDDYISKPINLDKFYRIIEHYI